MFTFEYEPNDRYPFERIKLSYEMLTKHMPYLKGKLGYYPMPRARSVYFDEKDLYDAAEFPVVLDEDPESDIGFPTFENRSLTVGCASLRPTNCQVHETSLSTRFAE
ncbi:MAG: hypothetical protein Ct9H300mP7_4100 [Verrucomicrobiota bacterium]|nr:MAG: hypothetical protein Ct9H300mP7_4100 [Verrucomicrobiota bacterium]